VKRLAVLFVCMGNICRSPTAEGVFRHLIGQGGLADQVQVDSAGTHNYHPGAPPDERSQRHAMRRGYDLSAQRARKIRSLDFTEYDLILAMDEDNLAELAAECPPEAVHKLHLLMAFAPAGSPAEVPDPYYGGDRGFEQVLDQVELACAGLVAYARAALHQ
jgi:protein-tyrosine phosphatase